MKTTLIKQKNAWLVLVAVLLAPAASVLAQGSVSAMVAVNDAPAVPVAPEAGDTNSAAVRAPVVSTNTSLAGAIRTMNFDRSPEAVLVATRAQRKSGKTTEAERFRMAVMLGDWLNVSNALAALPPEDAVAGYGRLLDALAGNAVSIDSALATATGGADNSGAAFNEGAPASERGAAAAKPKPEPLVSEDFYAVIDAAPGNLLEANIPSVSSLVKTALGVGGKKTLLARMAAGWKGVGGTTPEGHKLAAELLSSLGWITNAAPFLPLNNEQWADADTMQLVFAMEYFTQTGIAQKDDRQLQRAAELCSYLMKTSRFGNYTRPQFRLAMDRLVQLLPALDPTEAKKLIREQLFKQTATLADLIAVIGELGQKAATGGDLKVRAASLGTQNLLLQALMEKEGELPEIVAVLGMNWLAEAEACCRAGGADAVEMTQADQMRMNMFAMYGGMQRNNRPASLPTDTILATAPPLEVIHRLNPGLAQRVELTLLKVNMLQAKADNIAMLKTYVKAYPGFERDLCQDFLSSWVKKRTAPAENPEFKRMRAFGMYGMPPPPPSGSGIPLTRLRQNQNIQQFKTLLAELRGISPEPLDPDLVVQSFMTLHSGAEVYRLGDIEAIFGPPEKMVRAELLDLLNGMGSRLHDQWRDPKAQQQAGTNRSEQEAKDEVMRGYRTALELADRGIHAEDGDWSSFITRGRLYYDASQYAFDQQVKLSEYTKLRDEAFASYRRAAEVYAAKFPALPRGQWTIEPYQYWFFVMLGASDLSQLTISTARTDPGLKLIGDAMRALPGAAAEGHLQLFGKMLGDLLPRVPANVRQRFLNDGLKVIGEDHPAAKTATASLNYYRELLDEVQLRVTVDGPTTVGHTQPFGAFISIEATRQLLRESGGFGKYLQNQQPNKFGGQTDQNAPNYRDDFSKNIHAALDETFEVLSLTFHDSAVKPIDLPREGWVETPLIYAVLRAKNAAVDRLPSVQIDMDFVDQPGQVVLPVMSSVQPLDAKDDSVAPRPCANLALTLTMDEREWPEGKVVVEIQARGQGIIPSLAELFDCQRAGFDLATVDSTLAVSQFVSDGTQKVAQGDRNWQLTYHRKKDLRGDVIFHFPALKSGIQSSNLEYKHYQDADLVTVDAKQAASGVKLVSRVSNGLRNAVVIGLLGTLAIGTMIWLRRKAIKPHAPLAELVIPAQLTPFTVVAFLLRIQHEHAACLDDSARTALKTQITEIESGYFSGSQTPSLDLATVAAKWLRAVSSGESAKMKKKPAGAVQPNP